MSKIAKSDYFAGVFLSTILKSSKAVPILCDASEGVKRILFETDLGYFNTYVKYSTSQHQSIDRRGNRKRKKNYWSVNFTSKEYDYLTNDFSDKDKTNLVAIVCTNKDLTDTWIAVLTLEEAIRCMNMTTIGGNRTITVTRIGREHRFTCTGTTPLSDTKRPQPFVNHLRYFDKTDNINADEE
jgi:hypothetical protein